MMTVAAQSKPPLIASFNRIPMTELSVRSAFWNEIFSLLSLASCIGYLTAFGKSIQVLPTCNPMILFCVIYLQITRLEHDERLNSFLVRWYCFTLIHKGPLFEIFFFILLLSSSKAIWLSTNESQKSVFSLLHDLMLVLTVLYYLQMSKRYGCLSKI